MENNLTASVAEPKKSIWTPFLGFTTVLFLLSSVGLGFLYWQDDTQKAVTILPAVTPTPLPTSNEQQYKTESYGVLSYDYPVGWHVAILWPSDNTGPVNLVMDPHPIYNAPRGGPLGTFTISIYNGSPKPAELFQQKMDAFNTTNFKNIEKETITADIGTIYHFKGLIAGEMYLDKPVENYYLTYNLTPKDPMNQVIVEATLFGNKDPKISELFRHVILSFKVKK